MEAKINVERGSWNAEHASSARTLNYESSALLAVPHSAFGLLFVSQGYDRIECGGPPCRPDPKEESHNRAEDERDDDGEEIDRRIPVHQRRERDRAQGAEDDAENPADEAQHQGLDEEL